MNIQKLMQAGTYKLYGPYKAKDGRLRVIHKYTKSGERKSQSYRRYVMEVLLGRELRPEEIVDHIDNDYTNNDPSNFQVITYGENNRKARAYHDTTAKIHEFICPECGVKCEKPLATVNSNRKNKPGLRGPYCSRSCSGKSIYKLRGGIK